MYPADPSKNSIKSSPMISFSALERGADILIEMSHNLIRHLGKPAPMIKREVSNTLYPEYFKGFETKMALFA